MKPFRNISNTAPPMAAPVPRRKSNVDEMKQQAMLAAQANHSSWFCVKPEMLRSNPLKNPIKMAAGAKASNNAVSGEPFGFCGSFELVSIKNIFSLRFTIRKT
jgi:hypothetical protein